LKKEKKEKKVLREAYDAEKEKTHTLEGEVDRLRARIDAVEAEKRDKENKYLDLYMENSQQHEMIVYLQNQL
jgi:chromosome segregation ATPase